MPLHDWTDDTGWENFHSYWIFTLSDYIRPRLPEGYRIFIGSYSRVGLAMAARPDLGVTEPDPPQAPANGNGSRLEPDDEVAVAAIDPQRLLYVEHRGAVVAVVELVSYRNKDRPSERMIATARYAGYIRAGIHLMLVDLHPRPPHFSFPDAIAAELELPNQPAVPPPSAVVYRVGERSAAGGSYVAVWRRRLAVGEPLPELPLPLTVHAEVMVDLEATYTEAARRAYLA